MSEVRTGDCLAGMRAMPDASVSSIVTDPPYALGFMGRAWDRCLPDPEIWAEAFRVAKPGAYLVAFGAPRLYHRLACQIEDAGWILRDSLLWLFGSGFPKSLDVSKALDKAAGAERETIGRGGWHHGTGRGEGHTTGAWAEPYEPGDAARGGTITAPATPEAAQWEGWGTALKPAYEPIVLARKPFSSSVAANVLEHGTGAINVDGCRIGTADDLNGGRYSPHGPGEADGSAYGSGINERTPGAYASPAGRWPANLILGCACDGDHDPGCAVAMLDAQSGESAPKAGRSGPRGGRGFGLFDHEKSARAMGMWPEDGGGGASRFFKVAKPTPGERWKYTAKASRAEREAGLSGERTNVNDGRATSIDNPYQRGDTQRLNRHETVKPLALMRWLVRLVTPPGGLVLDPFTGSGSTGCAAALEGFPFLGFELDEGHAETARRRIAHWQAVAEDEARQATIFDEPDEPSPLAPWVQEGLDL